LSFEGMTSSRIYNNCTFFFEKFSLLRNTKSTHIERPISNRFFGAYNFFLEDTGKAKGNFILFSGVNVGSHINFELLGTIGSIVVRIKYTPHIEHAAGQSLWGSIEEHVRNQF
jgi:hypothetical protein